MYLHHESLNKHLHKTLEEETPSFPNALISTTPVKARKADAQVILLMRLPVTADMRGTNTVMVWRMKPALVAVVLPSAFVCHNAHETYHPSTEALKS